jgi:UDP-glucose 4-epimerase
MKNICITGSSGYLGTRLCQELEKRDDIGTIIGIDITQPKSSSKKLSFYKMDIRDPRIEDLLKKHSIDTIFHLAFVVKPIHDKKLMHDIDYNGTKNVLEAAACSGVSQVIAISSTLAYGAHADNPRILKEDDPLRGNKSFPYGHNKARVDEMVQSFARNHPEMILTILRPCTVFGPTVDNYVSRMLFRKVTVSVLGHDPEVQFVHEDDFVSACMVAAKKKIPGAFNIAGDGTLTTNAIAKRLGTILIPSPSWMLYPLLEILWRLHAPGLEVNRGYLEYVRYPFIADNGKAKKILGFQPSYTSSQTLEDTIKGNN